RSTVPRSALGSISSRNWPALTRSPSSTASRVTRPIWTALMFTNRLAWIVPDAVTIASRSRFFTASTLTLTASSFLKKKYAPPMAASRTMTMSVMTHFFRNTLRSSRHDSSHAHVNESDCYVDTHQRPEDWRRPALVQHRQTDGVDQHPPDDKEIDSAQKSRDEVGVIEKRLGEHPKVGRARHRFAQIV